MSKKVVCFWIAMIFSAVCVSGETAVQKYGQLKIDGTKLLDKNGKPVQLRGMSLYWSHARSGRDFYNANAVKWLVDDWKITIVRAAMAVSQNFSTAEPAYLTDPEANKSRVKAVVDAAIANGIYVIIDWHDHEANLHTSSAKAFFEEMAKAYGQHPNVIYEIFNEPEDVSWANVVKPYADTIIAAIRKIDSDNIIIVGNPNWCQSVRAAARNPVTQKSNVAYSLHFYAFDHRSELRSWAAEAISLGGPLFVSEFGTCDAQGKKNVDTAETKIWLNFLDSNKISWCNWSICTKVEAASALTGKATVNGNWPDSVLTVGGKFMRNILRQYANGTNMINSPNIAIKNFFSVIQKENKIKVLSAGKNCENGFELLNMKGCFAGRSKIGEDYGHYIPTDGLSAGLYIVRITGKTPFTFPLIIRH